MPKTRPHYAPEFRQQMVDLVRAGRDPQDLSREFEPSAHAIRNWVAEADAARRQPLGRAVEHRLPVRIRHAVPKGCGDEAGRDGVHPHRGHFQRQAARQRLQRGVDRALQHRGCARPRRKKARYESQRAAVGDPGMPRDAIGAEELGVHRSVRIILRELGDGAGRRGGCCDHDMVEVGARGEERLDRGLVRDVERGAAGTRDVGSGCFERVGGRGSDAAGRADDENAATAKIDGHDGTPWMLGLGRPIFVGQPRRRRPVRRPSNMEPSDQQFIRAAIETVSTAGRYAG